MSALGLMDTVDAAMAAFEEAMEKQDVIAALDCLDRALELDPRFVPALGIKGTLLGQNGLDRQALECFERIVELEPLRTAAHYSCGLHLQRMDRFEEAIAAYSRAIELDPRESDSLINRGRLLDDSGDPAAALRDYDAALAIDDGEEIAWCNRGNSLSSLERFEEACASFERALALNPKSAPAKLGRSIALMSLGRIEEADRARPIGTQLDPGVVKELRRPLSRGELVLRYHPRHHSAPEALEQAARVMLDHCAAFEGVGRGLADGVRIQYGWSGIVVRARGDQRVLCEPEYTRHPLTQVRHEVTFTLQTTFMFHSLCALVDAPPADCFHTDVAIVEPEALDRPGLTMVRLHERRDGVSGWVIGPESREEAQALLQAPHQRMPTCLFASRRPHLIKVLSLPAGYVVRFVEHSVVSVLDVGDREVFAAE